MTWKRRWGIVTVLALVQAGIIVWYQGFFSGSAAPAQSPSSERKVITPKAEPKKAMAAVPVASTDVPASPPFVVPAEFKAASSAEPPVGPEPAPLPKDLNAVPTVPVPPPPPAAALPESKPGTPPAPKKDEKLVPVKAEEPKPADPAPDARRLADGTTDTDVKPAGGIVVNEKNYDLKPSMPTGLAPEAPPAGGKPASLPTFTQTYAQAPTAAPPAPTAGAGAPAIPPPETKPAPPSPNPLTPPPPSVPPIGPTPVPGANPSPPLAPAPNPTPPATKPQTTEAAEPPCPWTLRVEMVKGRTLLTAQTGQEVQFRIICDKLDVQSPKGNIQASGNVKVESEGMKGSCDQLTIAWQADQVVLQGNAELKCQREGQEVDLQAAKLTLRLSVSVRPEQPRASGRAGEVRGTTFLSRSKSLRGDHRTPRTRQVAPGWQTPEPNVIQPTSGNRDGGYDRYLGAEPPRRSKVND